MTLQETYKIIKPSIVAIASKYEKLKLGDKPSQIPFILGTGFIVDDGLVVTNHHVAREVDKLPKPPNSSKEEWPVICLMFLEINQRDCAMIPLDVIGKFEIKSHNPEGIWYGDNIPDMAFLRVKATGLPILKLQTDWQLLREGMNLATSGFPSGRDVLNAPGYLHQMGPTLQTGILSALLPFVGSRPHAFILNVISLGGQSGSPVFVPENGEVVGILYGGYEETSAITYVLPAGLIDAGIKEAQKLPDYALPDDASSLEDIMKKYKRKII